jgi:hypothetical protein
MVKITRFCPIFAKQLPDTNTLLVEACLWVHEAVEKITLHGSRGPQGGTRPDSDMDLCLVVNSHTLDAAKDRDALLREALNTTLNGWRSEVKLDIAAVFDTSHCGLRCLDLNEHDPDLCPGMVDCMGIFKIPDGDVSGSAVDCSKMYPLITIWQL